MENSIGQSRAMLGKGETYEVGDSEVCHLMLSDHVAQAPWQRGHPLLVMLNNGTICYNCIQANSIFAVSLIKQSKHKHCNKLGSIPWLTAICSFQSCPEALRRLIGKFNGHLKECNGKLLMNLSGHPQAESVMDHLSFCNHVHQLIHEVESQVAVLQKGPSSLSQQQWMKIRLFFVLPRNLNHYIL